MNVLLMLLFGAGVGAGILLLIQALTPVSAPLEEIAAGLHRPGAGYRADAVSHRFTARSALVRFGRALTFGDRLQLEKDLAVTGSTLEQHALIKAATPATVLIATYVLWLALLAAGIWIGPARVTLFALFAAGVGFILPDWRLRRRATEARVAFRHALSAYLDLVTIIMSGGGGLVTALQGAADAGDGWAFGEIRAALDRARLSNRTPWSQLGVLGDRFDIPELRDLVSAAELAGSEGARISESVATKSDALRLRLMSEVEENSESLTEQMLIPIGLLLVALFLFLGFAVIQQLGTSRDPRFGPSLLDEEATHLLSLSTEGQM